MGSFGISRVLQIGWVAKLSYCVIGVMLRYSQGCGILPRTGWKGLFTVSKETVCLVCLFNVVSSIAVYIFVYLVNVIITGHYIV